MPVVRRALGVTPQDIIDSEESLTGRYLGRREGAVCSFEFGSEDWCSLIVEGRGAWIYRPEGSGATHFRTVYDYRVRYRALGRGRGPLKSFARCRRDASADARTRFGVRRA